MRTVTLKGETKNLRGAAVSVGDKAPAFSLVGNDFQEVSLESLAGKVVLLSCVPSLETPVCDVETKRFNEEAASLGDDVVIVTASMDLPFAQKRWCGQAEVENLVTASDFKNRSLIDNYGVLIEEMGLLARAVFVIDKEGVLQYVDYVSEIADEPDYDAVLAKVKELA